jgi:phosphomannomutase
MVDPMYGAGAGYMEHILCNLGHNVLTIHSEQPFCGQLSPEPKEENLGNLAAAVRESRADLGIALDGDGDRFGFIGPDGNYISPNQVFTVYADYMADHSAEHPTFARTVATTHMIDRVAEKAGIKMIETPVGFKYLAQAMLNEGAVLGAEESGGLGVNREIPEKDGIVAGLLLIGILSAYDITLPELMAMLRAKYGQLYSKRVDFYCTAAAKAKVLAVLTTNPPDQLAGRKLIQIQRLDGVKMVLSDGA